MAGLSRLFSGNCQKLSRTNGLLITVLNVNNNNIIKKEAGNIRCMSEHRHFIIKPSNWQWHKTKDWFHFYTLVGAIPLAMVIFYANVFIGPATLEEIPEGYTPEPWEYYRSPITRFFSKYLFPDTKEQYERVLCHIHIEEGKRRANALEYAVKNYIRSYQNYPYYAYREDATAKRIMEFRKHQADSKHVNTPVSWKHSLD